MTILNCRTNCRKLSQMRNSATVPLNREPLTHRSGGCRHHCRGTVVAATVSRLRFSYALNRRLAPPNGVAPASVGLLRLGYAPDMTLGLAGER